MITSSVFTTRVLKQDDLLYHDFMTQLLFLLVGCVSWKLHGSTLSCLSCCNKAVSLTVSCWTSYISSELDGLTLLQLCNHIVDT